MKFRIKLKLSVNAKQAYLAMCNPNNMLKWETNFTGFQVIKGQKRKLGSIAQRIYHEPDGHITKIKEEVTAIKKNELFAYQLTHKNFMSYVSCRFLDQGDHVVLIEESKVKFRPAILNLIGFMMKSSMKKQRQKDLILFKNLLESK